MTSPNHLLIPRMHSFYRGFAEPLAFLGLRVAVGALSIVEGWPKIQSPTAMSGFVENLGFYPGWFWSAALAGLQFFGGIMIVLGLLARPIALASAVMLAVTLWFHMITTYGDIILTP